MTKEQKQLIIVGFLIIILVIAGYNSFSSMSKSGRKKPAPLPAQGTVNPPVAVPLERADEAKVALQKARGENWGRDPFNWTAGKAEERLEAFKLQGVTVGNGTGFAFINDMIVRKGDLLGGYQVTDVFKDRVLLQKGEQKVFLTFPEE